ncbi:MAG: dual specificity protein phosphatase family protein [Candidatus Thermoplasmatota archaeon]|nr:dual specificity protein phosphatase family protein [Candidatus Thermoplasmatota archaeon]
MPMSEDEYIRWSRYGMAPYNWIVEGKLMASVYPLDNGYLKFLKNAEGVTMSINLAETPWPAGWSEGSGVICHHIPVADMSTPTRDQVKQAINIISAHNGPVMVHCAAGIGRTGTMIALYLVDGGMHPSDAITLVRSRRSGSIQTREQERSIYEWENKKEGPHEH